MSRSSTRPGPGKFVHVGRDAADDRPDPRQVDGDDGPARPIGGRAQVNRGRVAISIQVREPVCEHVLAAGQSRAESSRYTTIAARATWKAIVLGTNGALACLLGDSVARLA